MTNIKSLINEIAPTGRIRSSIDLENTIIAQKDSINGILTGISVDLARELGRRLNIGVELITFDTTDKAFSALKNKDCDVGFLSIDPSRADYLAFTSPYIAIEGTFIVNSALACSDVASLDQPGIRIAAGKDTGYDLYLSRLISQARIVHAPSSKDAFNLFTKEKLEAAAGDRQSLISFSNKNPGTRVIDENFVNLNQAIATSNDRHKAITYLRTFVNAMKVNGFVTKSLTSSGQDADLIAGLLI